MLEVREETASNWHTVLNAQALEKAGSTAQLLGSISANIRNLSESWTTTWTVEVRVSTVRLEAVELAKRNGEIHVRVRRACFWWYSSRSRLAPSYPFWTFIILHMYVCMYIIYIYICYYIYFMCINLISSILLSFRLTHPPQVHLAQLPNAYTWNRRIVRLFLISRLLLAPGIFKHFKRQLQAKLMHWPSVGESLLRPPMSACQGWTMCLMRMATNHF